MKLVAINSFVVLIIFRSMFASRCTSKMGCSNFASAQQSTCRRMCHGGGGGCGGGGGHRFAKSHGGGCGGHKHNGHSHSTLAVARGGGCGGADRHAVKGVPTKLINKTTLVQGDAETGRLPVHTLTFAIPPRDQVPLHGRRALAHADVALDLGDVVKFVIPEHKPTPYSVSAMRPDEFDVTFKVYPNGRASGFLDRLEVGDEIRSFGRREFRMRNPGKYVGIIAYGVGITEGLPIAQAELEKGDAEQVHLLWSSRTKADTFWHDDIDALQRTYPDKFRMDYMVSRERHNGDGSLHGRVNPEVLQQVFQPGCSPDEVRFHAIGTPDMMDMTYKMLEENGYSMPKNELLPHQE